MHGTKIKSKPKSPKSTSPTKAADSTPNVLTLAEAAAYLRVGEDELLKLVPQQELPGRQIGQEWRFLRPALDRWLSTPSSRDRLLRHAGMAKDDSNLDQMLVSIYSERGRPIVEERP